MNAHHEQAAAAQIALVDMPWDLADRPNAALGIIKPILDNAGYSVSVLHPNVWMGGQIGFGRYKNLSMGTSWVFFMEWMFSKAAFPQHFVESTETTIRSFPEDHLAGMSSVFGKNYAEIIAEIRDHRIDELCERVAEKTDGCTIVAFSCSLNQLVPAVAASRFVKERNPSVKILLGGSQVDSTMGDEILNVAPWIDATYKGEAEVALLSTVEWLLGRREAPSEEYVSYRKPDGAIHCAPGVALLQDMSVLPMPDYDPYFSEIEPFQKNAGNQLVLNGIPFVSSRGCWWGVKQHCTFCGLNNVGLAYRERDADVVLDEIMALSSKHKTTLLHSADNIIPYQYLKTFLPRLVERDVDLELFYETKANLKRRDLSLFRDAGIRAIQPGIESLNDHVLELMRKGTSGIQNIYLLKLCQEFQVYPMWNLIHGFPGETDDDYTQQIEWIPHAHHLIPPGSVGAFSLQRFSPFHFESERLGVTRVRAQSGYRHLFPCDRVDVDKLAFYFDFEYSEGYGVAAETIGQYHQAIEEWRRRWKSGTHVPYLTYSRGAGFLEIRDGRAPDKKNLVRVEGLYMEVLLAADDPISHRELNERFSNRDELRTVIRDLKERGLIITDEKRVLSLVLRDPRGADFFQMAFHWPMM